MRTLDQAWKEAQEYMNSLPMERAPNMSVAFSKCPHGKTPLTSNAYASVRMNEKNAVKGGLQFFSWHSRNYEDPATAIDHAIAAIQAHIAGRPQPRREGFGNPDKIVLAKVPEIVDEDPLGCNAPDPFS